MNFQLATTLAAISAQLDNLIQATESSNQTLDRIITKVEKKSDNTTSVIKESSDRDYSKLSLTIKCYKCQGYGHVAANCPTPIKVAHVREPPLTNSEPLPPLLPTPPSSLSLLSTPTVIVCYGRQHLPPLLPTPTPMITELVDVLSEEPICHVKESKDSDLDKKITSENLVESNTSGPLEVVLDITEFTDVSPKDSALNLPEVNPIVKESIAVFSENLPDKLLLTRDIQHAIELFTGANLPDLPHSRLDPIKQIELKGQVDELSLEVNQSCIVPINIHFYEDKFWNYIVTKDVGQIRDISIYGRSAVKDLRDVVMGEPHNLQSINFFSLTIKQQGIFTRTLPVKISLVIINKVIGKLSHTFMLVRLIIPFDRGREYY